MMTNEQRMLVSALSDFINERPFELPDNANKESLSALAKRQGVEAILYYQTHIETSYKAIKSAYFYYLNQKRYTELIYDSFKKESIPFLILKGAEIAEYYPKPELRSMGDIDLLVHKEDKKRAAEVLKSLGFQGDNLLFDDDHEWCFSKENCAIELHHRFLYDDPMNEKKHIEFSDKVWDFAESEDGIYFRICPDVRFVFLMLHLLKHFLYEGVTIRQFADIAVMIKKCDLDWKFVKKTIRELEIFDFSEKCFELIAFWFNIICPLTPVKTDAEFCLWASESVLSFDLSADDKKERLKNNRYLNTFRKEKLSLGGRAIMVVKSFFPGYSELKKRYPKLERLGFFGYMAVPLMWIHRAIGSLFNRSAGMVVNNALKPVTLGKESAKREEILKKWGI